MTRTGMVAALVLAAGLLGGCSTASPGTTRALGDVNPDVAFATARQVLGQYFPIDDANPRTQVITTRPRPVDAGWDRPLGGYPARQLATLRIVREDGAVAAHLAVEEQRQRSQMHRSVQQLGENYDSVPDQTPAEQEAATTIEQNEAWETHRYDHTLEARILSEIYRVLHPSDS